jgi:hypothetical protein
VLLRGRRRLGITEITRDVFNALLAWVILPSGGR